MANTYTQLYAHILFVVRRRKLLISPAWEESLHQYISGTITNKNQKLMAINGMPDHVHLLIGFKPNCNLSDLIRDVKAGSSKWINETHYSKGDFEWQKGFGAFSVGQSQIDRVVKYILNQKKHHQERTFSDEYIALLQAYQLEFKREYLFGDNNW